MEADTAFIIYIVAYSQSIVNLITVRLPSATHPLTLVDTPMPDLMMSASRGTSFSMTCASMCGMQNWTASIRGEDFEEATLI